MRIFVKKQLAGINPAIPRTENRLVDKREMRRSVRKAAGWH
jgi:hypothetical protein